MKSDHEHELEQRVGRALRSLPARAAPAALEQRVLAALAQRSTRSWWTRRLVEWPRAARLGFIGACIALAAIGVLAGRAVSPMVHTGPGLAALPGVSQVHGLLASFGVLHEVLLHVLPSGLLMSGLVVSGVLYALVFGLGTLAYRGFFVESY